MSGVSGNRYTSLFLLYNVSVTMHNLLSGSDDISQILHNTPPKKYLFKTWHMSGFSGIRIHAFSLECVPTNFVSYFLTKTYVEDTQKNRLLTVL